MCNIQPDNQELSLYPSELNHYRHSNLSLFLKTLERIVSTQLSTYLYTKNILNKYQIASCPDKSCETTLLAYQQYTNNNNNSLSSNILIITLDKLGILVVLLDFSAAFNTLNNNRILNRLSNIGITAHCLDLFKSFIYISVTLTNDWSDKISHYNKLN